MQQISIDDLATPAQYARMRGVKPQSVHEWITTGKAIVNDAGMIVISRTNDNLNQATTLSGANTIAAARLRREMASAESKEIEVAKMKGELISLVLIEDLFGNACQAFRDALLALPTRIAPELASLTDERQIRASLDAQFRPLLSNLQNALGRATASKAA